MQTDASPKNPPWKWPRSRWACWQQNRLLLHNGDDFESDLFTVGTALMILIE
jgi:hypothetical protein